MVKPARTRQFTARAVRFVDFACWGKGWDFERAQFYVQMVQDAASLRSQELILVDLPVINATDLLLVRRR
jgi:hypothetical protein